MSISMKEKKGSCHLELGLLNFLLTLRMATLYVFLFLVKFPVEEYKVLSNKGGKQALRRSLKVSLRY